MIASPGPLTAPRPGLPLSASQRGLWHWPGLPVDSPLRAVADRTVIDGPLRVPLFRRALRRTLQEAEALRVRLWEEHGRVRQLPLPSPSSRLPVVDLRGERRPERVAEEWMAAALEGPLAPEEGHLYEHALLRLAERRWCWFQRAHHVLVDAPGRQLVVDRTAEHYTALLGGRPAGPNPFAPLVADASAEEGTRTRSDAPVAQAPTRAPSRTTGTLPAALTARLRARAGELGVGTLELVLAAQALMTARERQRDRVTLGVTVRPEGTSRVPRPPTPVRTSHTVTVTVDAGEHHTLADLVRRLARAVRGAGSRRPDPGAPPPAALPWVTHPLAPPRPVRFGPARAHTRNLRRGPVGDRALALYETPRGPTRLELDGDPDRYDQRALRTQWHRLVGVLGALTEGSAQRRLGTLAVLAADEHAEWRRELAQARRPVPATTAIGPLEATARRRPSTPAVSDEPGDLDHRSLHSAANRLARRLVAEGVRPGVPVAVDLPHGPGRLLTQLAVWKAGGALLSGRVSEGEWYERALRVPHDELDGKRLDRGEVERGDLLDTPPARALTCRHPALVDRVRGRVVAHSHRLLDLRARWLGALLGLDTGSRVWVSPLAWEHWAAWPLRHSARVLLTERPLPDPAPTVWCAHGRELTGLLNRPWTGPAPAHLLCVAGELSPEAERGAVRRFPGVTVHRLLDLPGAPSVLHRATGARPAPCRPLWNTRALVLDRALRPCAPGVAGLLYVGGEGLVEPAPTDPGGGAGPAVPDPWGPEGSVMRATGRIAVREGGGLRLLGDAGTPPD
ncbi:condensation domain-containing protein [Streptomyces sp. NPDC005438]|uniref:condensation domain-containing protein n=1 Tax=Streptomyces sp. NPDC005438 TaxID=3156880 RepID=UPI0033B3351B